MLWYFWFGLFIICLDSVSTVDVVYDRVELQNDPYLKGFYNFTLLRISKYNRTTYVWNTQFELFKDVNDDFELEANFYYNRLNNNQYTKSFVRAPRDTVCNLSKKYKDFVFAESNKDKSNIVRADINYCPLKKGMFWAKNYSFDSIGFPAVFQEGHWRVDFNLYYKQDSIMKMQLYFKVMMIPVPKFGIRIP